MRNLLVVLLAPLLRRCQSDRDPRRGDWRPPGVARLGNGDFVRSAPKPARKPRTGGEVVFAPSAPKTSPVAYATLLGHVDAERPATYLGPFFTFVMACRGLRARGSTADCVLMVDFAGRRAAGPGALREEALARAHGVRVAYLGPQRAGRAPTFHGRPPGAFTSTVLRKFDAWLLDYDKVQFVDSDILPVRNMDYAFRVLDGTGATDAFGAGYVEPANAGWMLATPSARTYEALRAPWDSGLDFTLERGWGHRLPTNWTGLRRDICGARWDFKSAQEDQGLIYHYARFASGGTGAIVKHRRTGLETWPSAATPAYQALATAPEFLIKGRDYLHFTGGSKPWIAKERRLERYPDSRWGYELWHAEFKALAAATPEHLKGLVDVTFPLRGPSAGLYR